MVKKQNDRQQNSQSNDALFQVVKATAQVTTQYLTSPWLEDNLAQKFQWHSLLSQTMETASSMAQRNQDSEFFKAYLILCSRWFSHHEAIELLLTTGRYGDCMVLLRSLLEDTDLISYFGCFPEDSKDWMERLSRAPIWTDEMYRQGIKKFKMRRIWKRLRSKGFEPVGERDYSILSATVHASPWGARFYGRIRPGDPSRLYLNLAPVYDPAATFTAGLVLQGTYPRPIYAFLSFCIGSNVPESQWRSIQTSYDSLIDGWQTKMERDSWFRGELTHIEERVLRGEEPEISLRDIGRRIEEKYGKPGEFKGGGSPATDEEV